jgi:hypothetical protein
MVKSDDDDEEVKPEELEIIISLDQLYNWSEDILCSLLILENINNCYSLFVNMK